MVYIESLDPTLFEGYLDVLATLTHTCILQSTDIHSVHSDWDVVGWDPSVILKVYPHSITLQENGTLRIIETERHLETLNAIFEEYRLETDPSLDLPFTGGWMGFFSYEAAFVSSKFIFLKPSLATSTPLIELALYQKVLLFSKKTGALTYVFSPRLEGEHEAFKLPDARSVLPLELHSDPVKSITYEDYSQNIEAIKSQIYEGEFYQANYTYGVSCAVSGSLWPLYQRLREVSPAPFSAYLNFDSYEIVSASPERFIQIRDRAILTSPIKGTAPRFLDSDQDFESGKALKLSEKNAAELTMIVDLLRNDLGELCEFGSIFVLALKKLEAYAQVYHLVSHISGMLRATLSAFDVLFSMLPCGSITGAPKRASVAYLQGIETIPRNVYTGCIGYIGYNHRADFNVAIRTFYRSGDQLFFHAGGGIVADSDPDEEWRETAYKLRGLFEALAGYNS